MNESNRNLSMSTDQSHSPVTNLYRVSREIYHVAPMIYSRNNSFTMKDNSYNIESPITSTLSTCDSMEGVKWCTSEAGRSLAGIRTWGKSFVNIFLLGLLKKAVSGILGLAAWLALLMIFANGPFPRMMKCSTELKHGR